MKKELITITDIARALKMSASTVSRAIRGSHHVSEDTRKKVNDYAKANNYHPNLMAQGLRNKNSRSIGVLLCTVLNDFYAEVISGIESVAYAKNYHLIIMKSLESYEGELESLQQLQWRSVDGILASLSTETNDISHFNNVHVSGTPIVFFDRVTDHIDTHTVISNGNEGAYKATEQLIQSGYKRIAHITSSPNLSITKERLDGYSRALEDNGIKVNAKLIKYCMHGGMLAEENETAINELISLEQPPDAIIAASDRLTIACYSILHDRKISIPTDMAFSGFSNFRAPHLFNPSLTTIHQPAFEIGKVAAELLIELMESKRPVVKFKKIILPTVLTVRDSSARKIKSKR